MLRTYSFSFENMIGIQTARRVVRRPPVFVSSIILYYLDAASKESGARGRGAGRDGHSLDARAEVHVGQVVAHVLSATPDLVIEVASA